MYYLSVGCGRWGVEVGPAHNLGLFLICICRIVGMVSCSLCSGQFNECCHVYVTGGAFGLVARRVPTIPVAETHCMPTQASGNSVTILGEFHVTKVHWMENVVEWFAIS